MDKLIKRTTAAERQVSRRLREAAKRGHRRQLGERTRRAKAAVADLNHNIWNSRRMRHEAWELGPLAPRRTVENGYGVAAEHARTGRQNAEFIMRPFEIERRVAWAGDPKHLNLAVGDRVVILEGPDKGNIDTISSVSASTGTVELKEFGKIVAKTPEWLVGQTIRDDQTYPEHSVTSTAIPISAIRLVHPVTDPSTGVTRDVIIRQLRHSNVRRDRLTKTTEWDRYVPGLNTIIPWPEKTDPEEKQFKGDTGREEVQEATFVPTLLRAPMPDMLINELRNQYSRFRTRHEMWYIEKKIAEDEAKKNAKKADATMMTPVDEFNRQRRAERKALGEPVLSEDMLERLGEHMAKSTASREA